MEEKTASVNLCTQTAFERKRLQYCTIFVRINQSVTVPMDWLQTDKKVNKPYVRLKTNNGSFIEKIWLWKCITLKLAFRVKCQWRMQPGRSLVMVSECVPDRRGSGRGGGGGEKLSPMCDLSPKGWYTLTFCRGSITDQNKGFSIFFFQSWPFCFEEQFPSASVKITS